LLASKDNFQNICKFTFSKIFDENSTQEEIFNSICLPAIDEVFINKKSALIFAYGMTNSGKTHTVVGIFYFYLLCLYLQSIIKFKFK